MRIGSVLVAGAGAALMVGGGCVPSRLRATEARPHVSAEQVEIARAGAAVPVATSLPHPVHAAPDAAVSPTAAFGGPDAGAPSKNEGRDLDEPPEDGLTALCRGAWRGIDDSSPFRGIVPREFNTGGHCCPLPGRAFVCVMAGPQHVTVLEEIARFFDGDNPKPLLEVATRGYENPGMNPEPSAPALPSVTLQAVETPGGFVLRPTEPAACRRPAPATAHVCANAGTYTWKAGRLVRSR